MPSGFYLIGPRLTYQHTGITDTRLMSSRKCNRLMQTNGHTHVLSCLKTMHTYSLDSAAPGHPRPPWQSPTPYSCPSSLSVAGLGLCPCQPASGRVHLGGRPAGPLPGKRGGPSTFSAQSPGRPSPTGKWCQLSGYSCPGRAPGTRLSGPGVG